MKILQIDSSALGTQSATRELTQAIVQRWLDEVADIELVRRDLDAHPLPHLTGAVLGKSDPADAAQGEAVMGEFLAADVIVLGAPMYNFGVPSTLKAWIDRIAVSGRTFRYTASGPEGLVHGKKVIVASARGSVYGDSHPADFQEAYLRQVFGFLGIDDVEFIRAEGLGLSPQHRAAGLRAAHAAIGPPLALAA
ncbi:MAG: NAD(P)H-dependent oxidoreductase [Chiayiivirga sp.]|uniref:FMN-dependent NADH-azoreductase n=1 Tax=Chiayiivirga sp. TaxID=2041042 RepID=UPI0025C60EC0|nr:NAD(P)H-dependent oxidoreductase [Chiayiivirga sp.]MCI1729844.1 NAD(P)H-dependent oxidoreductase [Chiayiivirga sp.]